MPMIQADKRRRYISAYVGRRTTAGCVVFGVIGRGTRRRPLRHVVHYSRQGFNWGRNNGGAGDLALSLLVAVLGEALPPAAFDSSSPAHAEIIRATRAWALHRAFQREVVAHLPFGRWKLSVAEIEAWLAARG